MKTRVELFCLVGLLAYLVLSSNGSAQDLAVTNARIIDGTGTVIEQGSLIIRDGRIASVSSGPANVQNINTIDAKGMSVLPGFIDAHRHIIRGNTEKWFRDEAEIRMQEFLNAGFTTLMSGGGPVPGILELKQRIEEGELEGPRIITSGRADPRDISDPEVARKRVRFLADSGVDIIKAAINSPLDKEILAIVVDEARKHDLDVMVHAVTPQTMIAAVEAGAAKLVHTPHGGYLHEPDARMVAEAGIENLSTVGFAVPVFGVFNNNNVPTFRDGSPWPEGILGTGSNAAGEKIVNSRTLWDAGVTYGFGTDTSYHPRDGLYHELKVLNLMFSPRDIIKLMGPNTAAFIDMPTELGTLEPGKLADIVIVDGNPLNLIFDRLQVEVVIQNGEVVADNR